ncbi:MarR family winged helix-turn-helix transcriptional regulator [Hwanghaeella sp.]|uniref:MarR family winged helix-turn-helix transcriptional regulator n=1 Tax=Hwanghaeella sp. TaxID=2605943 RepID=UPI003CCB8342
MPKPTAKQQRDDADAAPAAAEGPSDPDMPRPSAESRPFVDDYLLYLMARASALASAGFHNQIRERGMQVYEWRIMAVLYGTAGVTVGGLARRCLIKQPSVTKNIDRMEERGLVQRSPSPDDRRQVIISLTDLGTEIVADLVGQARIHEAAVLEDFSAEEADTLKRVLRRLIERHKEDSPTAFAATLAAAKSNTFSD